MPHREIVQQGTQPQARWKILWDQARAQARAGHPAVAADLYEEVLRLKGDIEEARWELARIWLLLKKPDRALPHLERLVEMAPANGEYQSALAGVLQQRGQYGRSVELYGRALEAEPANSRALKGISENLLALGKRAEAVPYLERWYAAAPATPGLRRLLADVYYDQGWYDKARPFLADLAVGSRDPELLRRAALTHAKLGLASQAAEYWKKLLHLDPASREARAFLAEYYEKEGQGEEALVFLLPRVAHEPRNPALLKRVGQLYLTMGQRAMALPYFERYVELRPTDREVLRLVVDLNAGLGNRAETLASLERLLAVEPQPELAKLKQAAYLYEAQGQLDRALPLYERIIESTPDDPEIVSRLAQALSTQGDDQAAQALWEQLGKRQKLLEALEGLHGQEPANRVVMLRLATMYLAKDALEKSRQMFDKLAAAGERSPNFLAARGSYYERIGQLDHALTDYDAALAAWPTRHELRVRCLRLAGALGYDDRVTAYAGVLVAADRRGEAVPPFRLAVANAYRDGGLWQEAAAWYGQALAQAHTPQERTEILLELARLHEEAGRLYEAEQTARTAALESPGSTTAYLRLFDLALRRQAIADAATWLAQLENLSQRGGEPSGPAGEGSRTATVPVAELQARLLAAQGEHKEAIRRLRVMLAELSSVAANQSSVQSNRLRHDLIVLLGRSLLAAGRAPEAEVLLRREWTGNQENLAAAVVLIKVYAALGQEPQAREIFAQARKAAEVDAGRVIELLRLCGQEKCFAEVLAMVTTHPELAGHSLVVQRAEIVAAANHGEQEQALDLLAKLSQRYPAEYDLVLQRGELLSQRGHLAEALQALDALPAAVRQQPEARLLRGRIQWTMGDRPAALRTLQESLTPSVEEELVAAAHADGVGLPVVEPPGLWSRIVEGGEESMPIAALVMMPQHFLTEVDSAKEPGVSHLATPLYARYEWQRRIEAELRAKKAVDRREYFAAAKEYEKLVREYPTDGSVLYDLAGVYSKLEQPAEEAAIYATLQANGEEYPGLAAAAERNQLQREPHSAIAYSSQREEGRGGYKAMEQERMTLSHRYAPGLQQEITVDLNRIDYRSTTGESAVKANRAEAGYARRLFSGLTLSAGGGVSALEDGANIFLARCALAGDLGDRLWTSLSYRRDVVEDTVASLTRAIVQEAVKAKAAVDLLPRLQVGTGYDYTGFSDNNWTQGYDLWASYILITDPTLLKLTYTYDFKDSLEAPRIQGPVLADGFAAEDHPYWAPRSYWQKRFNVFFRHQLGDDPYRREAPRYYTASYTLIYDSNGYPLQAWEGGLFVEWLPGMLLKASGGLTTGKDYRSRGFSLSLIHRW